jgi:hypothetical protein
MPVATGFDDGDIDKFREQVRQMPDEEVKGLRSIYGVLCGPALGIWWADSTYLRERFHILMRSSRFVK